MKRRNIVATLLAVGLALGTAVGAPAAVAAQCRYVAQDLPLPSGMSSAEAVAATEDNSMILGQGNNLSG
ncbi:hypothetical protein JOF56_000727 [Kibdelosporangium banguiense]|uniref:Uncharacterized protein n=1 Tax=Kibdelosporangium banguiense TaxID=1365924 RepID=A0ABS4T7E2_9PSEU|nr:hypothetical protein [Kibdelosporangium banguiense]MBP2320342.1 hypothetical protein [Kibdelosporangium banguiense]